MSLTYKKAGVDIKAGEALVSWLKNQSVKDPHQDKIVSGIGGLFASADKSPTHAVEGL